MIALNMLSKHVLDILFISEIGCQSILHGINATLNKEKKKLLISKLIYIRHFGIDGFKIVRE